MLSGPLRWAIILIGAAIALNYIDRGAVSVAAPLIKDEFGLTNERYGVIVSSFYWTYVPALALAGWLADKMSVRLLMALGVATWALATIGMGFVGTGVAGGITGLLMLRLLMGLGEGVAFPCGSKLIARVPEGARSLANVSLSGGLALGPLIGTLGGGFIMEFWGWREMFIIFGLVTLVWLVPWWLARRGIEEGEGKQEATLDAAVPLGQVLRQPAFWAITLLHLAGTFGLYFIVGWLPLWLVKARGFSIIDMSLLTSVFYVAQIIGGTAGAWLIDRAIRRGADGSVWRRRMLFGSVFAYVAGLMLLPEIQGWLPLVTLIAITGFGYGPLPNMLFVFGQTMAGPASAGRWVGVQTSIGNLSGIVGPVLTGIIVDAAGYRPAFLMTAAVVAGGTLIFARAVKRIEPVRWAS
ncbi:MFS transporter [Sandarakinorhabdus sp. AAP62]|uniref:MFS transporter n=1 Tax=Sandarakinorhabdus sp. AAP62 TaxID=1248916 RepID=UPI000301F12A|nr:MFS transporter [Sandarakinorhabdus sp. AAP62]